jgi:cellulose synthase (UDP-forming)
MLRRRGRSLPSLRRALLVSPFWFAGLIWMWSWWLAADHPRYMPLFIPLTLALFYEFALLPSIFLFFVIKARVPKRRLAQKHLKVAVISPCVPSSESLDIVERQLKAMVSIKYPHDSWVLDEGGRKEIKALAKKYGVKYFTRHGIEKYNQPAPPFQAKTKAGNINAWLERVKPYNYDNFVQLDIDHIPETNYLHKTLGYFRDPKVGFVQAPSVYGNLDSWTARGAAEQELVLQGPLQMGFYGFSETPFIIGSHCTYRMSAIREIGGFQPTRAEDHLDTVYLASNGYKGVYLPEIIAVGDGPELLHTYLGQQYAWAYSMCQVLMSHTPKKIWTMTFKQKLQFLFGQTWYPFWALSYFTMFITPVLALLAGRNVVTVQPEQMLVHFLPLYVGGFAVWLTGRPLMQPKNIMLSWRGIILHAVRWPILANAQLAAAFRIKKPYMITPKGSFAHKAPSARTYRPFLMLGLMSAGMVTVLSILRHGHIPEAQAVFAIANSIFMLFVCVVDAATRMWESRPKLNDLRLYWLKPIGAMIALACVVAAAIIIPPLVTPEGQVYATGTPTISNAVRPVTESMTTQELIEQIRLVPTTKTPEPNIGMYNDNQAPKAAKPYIEHEFVSWQDSHYLAYSLAKSLQDGNTPLITLEPRAETDGAELLTDIANGTYDARLSELASVIKASKNPVYIRFGHEMELANLYAWGDQDPQLSIAAYRHVIGLLRTQAGPQVRSVWSPAGNPGAEAYYPGDEYVDVIGTTVLYDQYWYGGNHPTFADLSSSRSWIQQYGKPVWVVEFGAGHGDPVYQKQLVDDALNTYQSLGYSKLIYLNMVDANIVGPNYHLDNLNEFGGLFR